MTNSPASRRVRLEGPEEASKKGRSGCLALGGVLGILAGIMVALYALPPILKHYYGEKTVAFGAAGVVDGVTFRVTGVQDPCGPSAGASNCAERIVTVALALRAGEARYDLPPSRFQLGLEGFDDWLKAATLKVGIDTPAALQPGEPAELTLAFSVPAEARRARLLAIHVTSPRTKLELR